MILFAYDIHKPAGGFNDCLMTAFDAVSDALAYMNDNKFYHPLNIAYLCTIHNGAFIKIATFSKADDKWELSWLHDEFGDK